MVNLGRIKSLEKPNDISFTDKKVFLATNISPYKEDIDGYISEGYEYDCIEYNKDEYIASLQQQILDTQLVICDLYEAIGGNSL